MILNLSHPCHLPHFSIPERQGTKSRHEIGAALLPFRGRVGSTLVVDSQQQPFSNPRQVRLARICHKLHPLLGCRHGERREMKFLEHLFHLLPGASVKYPAETWYVLTRAARTPLSHPRRSSRSLDLPRELWYPFLHHENRHRISQRIKESHFPWSS
eukprot:768111-Hanusia_phi.AAC.1